MKNGNTTGKLDPLALQLFLTAEALEGIKSTFLNSTYFNQEMWPHAQIGIGLVISDLQQKLLKSLGDCQDTDRPGR